MSYSTANHTTFYHRYHVVWATMYRNKILHGAMCERLRVIIRQTCAEPDVHIVKGVLARDHIHLFIGVPPRLALATVMQRIKGLRHDGSSLSSRNCASATGDEGIGPVGIFRQRPAT